MVRNYVRKTNRGTTSEDTMRKAIHEVLVHGKKVAKVARNHGIPWATLIRYINMQKAKGGEGMKFTPTFNHRQVFSQKDELALPNYLLTSSKMYHGLSPKDTRRLAFEYAQQEGKTFPDSWKTKKLAEKDWLRSFLKRTKKFPAPFNALSIRTPEALGRPRKL